MTVLADEVTLAWCAGILEGEGYIAAPQWGRSALFKIAMVDRDVVASFAKGLGLREPIDRPPPKNRPNRQMQYEVGAHGQAAYEILIALRPYMHSRRGARIDAVIAHYRQRYESRLCSVCGRKFTLKPKAAPVQKYCGNDCARVAKNEQKRLRRKPRGGSHKSRDRACHSAAWLPPTGSETPIAA